MSATELHHSFAVEGMTCASCSRIVERSLNKLEGIKFVSVNLATHKAYVVADGSVTADDIQRSVVKSGYRYSKELPGKDLLAEEFAAARRNIFTGLAFTVPLMVLMILHMTGVRIPLFYLIETLMAGIVLFIPGRATIGSAFNALRHGHTNMNTLISVSSFVSWLTAVLSAMGILHISFGTIAAMILTFHLGGRYIEARLKHKAAQDVKSLLEIRASSARILSDSGIEEVPVEAVKPGMIVLVRTGEKVPLDGRITEGSASVDESMITGEPIPVKRNESEQVIGGTIVQQGSIRVKVEKVGEDTFLAQMIRLVDEAQSARIPLQALADRISFYFVPVILLIASLSAAAWYLLYPDLQPLLQWASAYLFWVRPDPGSLTAALFAFITILVIACPCALGLATPIALIAGSGKAARNGILIKNGEALQHSRSLKYMLMDKTGTITRGEPQVVETSLSWDLLIPVAAVESHSVHPLAAAIVSYVHGSPDPVETLKVTDLTETSGQGISGRIGEDEYRIGKPENPAAYTAQMEKGRTVVEVMQNGRIAGWIAIADPVKPEAANTIRNLKQMGIIPVMLTGDAEKTAAVVAGQVGIHDVKAGISPDRKAEIVRSYRRRGDPVGMVGDGINDAAALKTADVGFAIGNGTDLSIESADIVLIRDSLSTLESAVSV